MQMKTGTAMKHTLSKSYDNKQRVYPETNDLVHYSVRICA
jgi:hypothetical protein